ncbi:exosortase A [Thiohalobacter sp. IOR34]|uniref:exosortase A n=1 Tax=Thiohalobacter sp. IOR34 TaxID=3057176 RepID=UPI0025B0686B|nr:exosortase A [Thiohalobacter sp. IOR34]WJW74458.1 exosortase A [Thiohalobacter sp. IOR34]
MSGQPQSSATLNAAPGTVTPGLAYAACIAGLLLLAGAYWQTIDSMVAIWSRSETFAHGYLVLPVSLYLVWRKRQLLQGLVPRPAPGGLLLLLLSGAVWLLAQIAEVNVVQQLAFVAMVPATVITVLGWRIARAIAFPLLFLFFAVPMGEGLITPLMDFTAGFTVTLIRLSGIPVYVEGTFFSIPSGDWSVVEGCSGIRYLIASVTMGTLYAYLSYRRWLKRLLFVAFSIVLPIIANGLRAYMIVMIAHLSDMKLALGVDHLIYGWVFFGLVMLFMFWVGGFWQDPDPDEAGAERTAPSAARVGVLPLWGSVLAALLSAVVWPAAAARLEAQPAAPLARLQMPMPVAQAGWQEIEAFTDWRPHYRGMDQQQLRFYGRGDERVGLYLAYYVNQRQDAELVNSRNLMIPQKHPVWQNVGEARIPREVPPSPVYRSILRSAGQRLFIYHWYWIDGRFTANPYLGKLLEAKNRLLHRRRPSIGIVVFTDSFEQEGRAQQVLEDFLHDMLPALRDSLRGADARVQELAG